MAIDIIGIELTVDSAHHALKEMLHLVHTAEAMDPLRDMLDVQRYIDRAKDSLRGAEVDPSDALLWLGYAYRELTGDDALRTHAKALQGRGA